MNWEELTKEDQEVYEAVREFDRKWSPSLMKLIERGDANQLREALVWLVTRLLVDSTEWWAFIVAGLLYTNHGGRLLNLDDFQRISYKLAPPEVLVPAEEEVFA